ncbi:MAG TPA: PIG-L family deacetylase [Saprospiraceae bacterium]|nr:PIG-L family deacetylase [Saprospiraceae bacterium]
MISLQFEQQEGAGLKILCLGAHCDDIEIGCGGTLLKMIEAGKVAQIKWIVFASNEERKKEAIASAEAFLINVSNKEITVLNYRDAFLNFSALAIKEFYELIKKTFDPDLIFTHYRNDRHQDHRLISDLTWNTFRSHLILEYEIPKYDGDLGIPNSFFHLTEAIAKRKVNIMLEKFQSQKNKHWFDQETFLSLMRIRGMEAACLTKYAEAFHMRKVVFL